MSKAFNAGTLHLSGYVFSYLEAYNIPGLKELGKGIGMCSFVKPDEHTAALVFNSRAHAMRHFKVWCSWNLALSNRRPHFRRRRMVKP